MPSGRRRHAVMGDAAPNEGEASSCLPTGLHLARSCEIASASAS